MIVDDELLKEAKKVTGLDSNTVLLESSLRILIDVKKRCNNIVAKTNENNQTTHSSNIIDLLMMSEDIEFEPPRLDEKLYYTADLS